MSERLLGDADYADVHVSLRDMPMVSNERGGTIEFCRSMREYLRCSNAFMAERIFRKWSLGSCALR